MRGLDTWVEYVLIILMFGLFMFACLDHLRYVFLQHMGFINKDIVILYGAHTVVCQMLTIFFNEGDCFCHMI